MRYKKASVQKDVLDEVKKYLTIVAGIKAI
jgi:hypothetical protein